MNKKITFTALVWAALFALSGCGTKPDTTSDLTISETALKTTDIFNIETQSDMTVTLYYDIEEPTITFIMPDGTELDTDELPTDRGNNAVCYHIADAAPGQWQMAYDKKSNNSLDVNWAPDIRPIFYT